MGSFDEMRQAQVFFGPDRHVDMPAFRCGHHAAPGRVMDRRRVEAGADIDHQHRPARHLRCFDQRTQVFRGNMAQGIAGCLQIVQDRHDLRPGGAGQGAAVNAPVQIGHRGDAVLDRACRRNAGAIDRSDPAFGKIARQDGVQPRKPAVAEPPDAVSADTRAISQGDAGVGPADVGNKAKRGFGHRQAPVRCAGSGGVRKRAGKGVIGCFRGPLQGFEIDMHQAKAFFIPFGPFIIVQK